MAPAFDLNHALRWLKPHKRLATLARRADENHSFATPADIEGAPLLFDTCVYVDVMQRRTPDLVDDIMRRRGRGHSTICLAELTHVAGRLDPRHPDTAATLREVEGLVSRLEARRLHAPDAAVMGAAGVMAGILFRTQGYAKGQEYRVLHDAVLFLQARQRGWTVLTRNVGDFDLLQQMVPDGRVLFYRPAAAA